MKNEFSIKLANGSEDTGLALLLKDLLTQNLDQNPHKIRDFIKLDIGIGLLISDADLELTMDFVSGILNLYPGIREGCGIIIKAEADTVMALSNIKIKLGMPYYFDAAGMEIVKAMGTGRLKIKGMLSHFPSLIRLSRVMSVH